MPPASVHAVSIPIPIPSSSSSRSRTTARKTTPEAAVTPTSQSPPLPPLPASPPTSSAFPASTAASASNSPPPYMASTSFADINIRDFFPEGDNALLKFMDEASIIRTQREALIALNEAALERALRESQQTAAKEEESRKKGKGKQKQKEEERQEDVSVPVVSSSSPSSSSGTGVTTDGSVGASTLNNLPVPVGGVTGDPEAQGTLSSASTSLSSQVPAVIPEPPAVMPSSPPAKRCSTDEAAARLLAREWRVASLQGALFANPDMMPSAPASSSISSSSSPTPPPSSSTSSPPSSSASTARKSTSPSSSTRAAPMTIPAEAFYPRTNNQHHHQHQHHHHNHHHHRNSSSTSSPPKNSTPVQTGSVTPDHHKIKLSPSPPTAAPRVYTSASSAAAAQVAAKNNASPHSEKSRVGTATHSKTSSASTSHSGTGKPSQGTPAAGTTSPRKSVSPERAHITTAATATAATTGSTPSPAAAVTSIPSSEKRVIPTLKAHTLTSTSTTSSASTSTSTSRSSTPNTSPGISPSPSVAPLSSSSAAQASPVMTSASKVAAAAEKEREKARMAKRVSTSSASASASAAAKRTLNANTTSAGPSLNVIVNANANSSPARPLIVERDRDIIIPSTPTTAAAVAATPLVLSALSSPLLRSTFATIETTALSLPSKAAATSGTTTPPRDVEELFSPPAKKDVVPISSLLESDDEDDGGDGDDEDEDDDDEDDESEDEDDTKSEATASVTLESIPFRDLYTANRSCSKCGESILSPRNTFPVPAYSYLHISCPKCTTLHCRGCSTPTTKCPKNCTGSKSCMIKECCPQIRAIAIFEALSTFDHEFLQEAGLSVGVSGGGGGRQREEYIQAMITRPLTAQSKKLEMTFVKCVDALTEVFKAESSFPSASSTSKGVVDISTNIATLFERSLMPEVIHAFLRNTTVRDWIAHCETYCSILELLRYMTEGAVGGRVMAAGLRKIERSCGLKEWMWGRGEIVWVEEGGEGGTTEQAREKIMVMYRGQLRGGAEKASSSFSGGDSKTFERELRREDGDKREGTAAPLKSLMNELETHRGSLLEFLAKVSFMPTVMKLNALCDGISYLVLGQVLAGI